MLDVIYLAFNAFIFVAAGAYCIAKPDVAASKIGFKQLDNSGHSEFLAVYGGLQLGLAAFYAYVAYTPELRGLGILFSVMLYGGIAPLRLIGVARYAPVSSFTKRLAAGEVLLLLGAIALAFFVR